MKLQPLLPILEATLLDFGTLPAVTNHGGGSRHWISTTRHILSTVLLVFAALLGVSTAAQGQTTLSPGDMAIIAVNASSTDAFAIVLLKDIAANTVINFTDNSFNSSTAGRTSEGYLTYTAPAAKTAGTVLTWTNGMSISGTGWSSNNPSNFALNGNGGDQLFAFQGPASDSNWTSQSGITLLYGVQYGAAPITTGTASSQTSYQPSTALLPAAEFVIFSSTTALNNYFANGSSSSGSVTVSGTVSSLLTLFDNSAKWFTSSSQVSFPTYSIAVTSSPAIATSGTLSAVNTTYGSASATPSSFTVSGTNMTAGITVTPPAGFEVSQTAGGASGFAGSGTAITVGSSGTIAAKTIYVRLVATATVAGSPYSGDIVCSSTGAASANVATVSSSVSAKGLTITGVSAVSKTYDASASASLSGTAAYSGLANGESFSVTGTPAAIFANVHAGTAKTVIVSGYTAPSTNYSITQPVLSADITAQPLTITANNVSKMAGTTLTGGTGSTAFTSSGLISPETIGSVTISYGNGAAAGDAAGIYSDQVIASAATGGTFTPSDYAITYNPGDISVTTGPTIILGGTLTAVDTVYGTATPTPASFTVTGSNLTGDLTITPPSAFRVSTSASSNYATSLTLSSVVTTTVYVRIASTTDAGTYSGSITVSGGGATQQTIAIAPSVVSPKGVTINGVTASNKVYDGDTTISLSGTPALNGVLAGDTSSVAVAGTPAATVASAAVGTGKAVAVTGYIITSSAAANYSLSQPTGLTADITTKALTVSSAAVTAKAYDGTNAATITGTLSGVAGSDDVVFNGTGTFASNGPGTGIAVTSTSTLSGTAAGNYSLTQPTGLTGDITASNATVTITATDASAAEANNDPGTFRISRTGSTTSAVTVNYTIATGAGQATSADYTPALTGTATIAAGQAFADVTITPVDDVLLEGDETVTLTLASSANYDLGGTVTATVTIIDNETSIDLSKYVRVGRYDLPEPTRTTAPSGSLLAQEASAVTYNWDTNTLFIVGDGGTSVVQVSKTGQLINSMTLASGSSAQGTTFYDTEGISYVGNGKFVLNEERDRQTNLFTYVAGGTLHRSDVQTVKLGTTIGNVGLEGVTYDPQTGGFIFVKEKDPESIFQTNIDFAAGTATNGSATATSSTDLFAPSLVGTLDFSDIFALSNLPALAGKPASSHLLLISQESGQIVHLDRNGTVYNRLTIVADPGSPLTVPDMTMEGVTMDRDGVLYICNENGGGDASHPQLWVYKPSVATNFAPTAVALTGAVSSIPENTSTAAAVKVADIAVTDDGLGTNTLTVTGADAASFQITGAALFLKAGTTLNATTKSSYSVTVTVDDTTVGSTPDATTNYTLAITAATSGTANLIISEVAPWSSTNGIGLTADWFEVTNTGTAAADITGWKIDDSSPTFATSLPLTGITSIAPGESVIFIETSGAQTAAGNAANFKTLWFGSNPPANLQIGAYTGSGVGLSTGGDAVNLFDTAGTIRASVNFGSSPAGPYPTFDNAVGLTNATISTLSAVGVNGAFAAAGDANEKGSPGTIGASTTPIITIVATDANAAETGSDTGTFRISRTGSTVGPLTVNYTIATGAGQATSADYSPALTGVATIASSQASVDIVITPVDDTAVEGSETLTLTLGDTGSYDVGSPGTATITIADNDIANMAPTAVALSNTVTSIPENTSTASAVKLADIVVTDDAQGTNTLSVTGTDASFFQITGTALYLKAGTSLSFATKPSYSVTVSVDDTTVGSTPDATVNFTLALTQVVPPASVVISEVAPWSSGIAAVGADWFELTNTGTTAVDITGWKVDDNSNSFAAALPLTGITSIAPGESVIFLETSASNQATIIANFKSVWFGTNVPAGLQIGTYNGSGVGLGSSGDAVNIFNSSGVLQANVVFGASPTGPFATFNNAAGLNNATISTLSAVGVNGAFAATNDANEIGSPGTITAPATSAPVITTQPVSQSASVGSTVTLTVAASGNPVPTFQWYQGASGVTTSPVAGATSATYTTPALTVGTSYWARATNSVGTADSSAATITVGYSTGYSSSNRNILTPNTGAADPAGVTLNGTTFVNLGLQGVGRVAASTKDPVTGESLGSISDMQVTGWTKNADGTYTGTFNTLPDRGYNSDPVFSNYAARINAFDFSFAPYTSASPTSGEQIALSFAGSTRFTYDNDGNSATPPVFTTGLNADGKITLFGTDIPVASGSSTQSDGTVTNRLTLDSEGLAFDKRPGKAGSGWIGDEYGGYIYHFNSAKQIDGVVRIPAAIVPHKPAGTVNFNGTPNNGRRDNQGMEGVAQSPDGTKLFGLLQSATIQDSGSGNIGRSNTRLLVYDISSTDTPTAPVAQYLIQLPLIDDTGSTTNGTTVTRNGAQSSILALNNHQILILSRDGNGRGATGSPVFKSILIADINGATNFGSTYDAEGTGPAPGGNLNGSITPMPWTEALNMIGKLGSSSISEVAKFGLNLNAAPGDIHSICEKWESMGLVSCNDAANPNDFFLFIGNDNDFLTSSGKYLDAAGNLQSYDSGLENDTVILAFRVRIGGTDITPYTPAAISATGTLAAVDTVYGMASPAPTSFTVSGTDLTAGITVTPPAGFEVSQTSSTDGYASSITVGSSGTVAATTVYVRLAATTAAGSYAGNIVLSSTGVASANVATVLSTVSAKALTITGLSGSNKAYDGTTAASLSGTAALNGLVAGDEASVILGGTSSAMFASASVANDLAITVSGYTVSGTAAANYSLVQPAGLTASITAKALTVTGAAVTSKIYDGTTAAVITGTLSGVISPDVVTFNGTGTFASTNVGTGISVTSTSTLGGAQSDNYTLTQPTGLTGSITASGTTKPTVVVSSPLANASIVTAATTVTVTGTATDKDGVGNVQISLNGGATFISATLGNVTTTAASKTVAWSATITPVEGANSIVAKAINTHGNSSALTVARNFTYHLASTLTIVRNVPAAQAATPDLAGNVTAVGALLPTTVNLNPKTAVVQLGNVVKLTPSARVGFVFKGWSVSPSTVALTPGTANSVTFNMVAGAVVTAEWTTAKPTVLLTAPLANAKITTAATTQAVAGTATATNAISSVQVSLDGGTTFTNATLGAVTGKSVAWTATVTPVEGINSLVAKATDVDGNSSSLTLPRSFTYHLASTLTVLRAVPESQSATPDAVGAVVAVGAVLPATANLNPKTATVQLDTTVRLIETPKAGFMFKGWSFSPSSVTPTATTVNSVSFTMVPNLTVTAEWVKNPYISGAGSYVGLIKAHSGTTASNSTQGLVRATLTSAGTFSGSLTIDGSIHAFTGSFDAMGASVFGATKASTLTIDRSALGKNNLVVDLAFNAAAGNNQITGTVTADADVSDLVADKAIYSVTNPVPSAFLNVSAAVARGYYTVAFPTKVQNPPVSTSAYPQGDGYATITLTNTGAVTMVGTLADGTVAVATSSVVEGSRTPVFAQILTPGSATVKGGSFGGLLVFDITPGDSDVQGTDLEWFRPAVSLNTTNAVTLAATNLYTDGWPAGIKVDALGAQYNNTTDVATALELGAVDTAHGNALLVFSESKLTTSVMKSTFNIAPGTAANTSLATKIPATDASYTLSPVQSTGLFSGIFTPNWASPATAKPLYRGILLQKGGNKGGYGFFISNATGDADPESGGVTLSKQP